MIDPSGNVWLKNAWNSTKNWVSNNKDKIINTSLNVLKGAVLVVGCVAAVAFTVATFGAGAAAIAVLVAAAAATTVVVNSTAGNIQQTWTSTKDKPQGDNYVRDGLFEGDQKAFNTYQKVGETAASVLGTYAFLGGIHNSVLALKGKVPLAKYTQKQIELAAKQKAKPYCEGGKPKATVDSKTTNQLNGAGELPNASFTTSKLQHEFKHARDFGVTGNWNKATGEAYQKAIQNHISTATDVFKSTYRGQEVNTFINKSTGIGAYTDLSGNYIGGWKFSAEQIDFHFTNGIKIN